MAVRFDQDTVIKYADKVFLGLAVVLLLVAVVSVLMPAEPEVTYSQVANAYQRARQEQERPLGNESKEELDASRQVIESQFSDAPEDQKTLALLRSMPSYVSTFKLTPAATPFRQFAYFHQTPPSPEWAAELRRAAYVSIQERKEVIRNLATFPPQEQRGQPVDLLTYADMAYLSSGGEANGNAGYDVIYIAGQFRIDMKPVLEAWQRAAAAVPDVQRSLRTPVLNRYEVQRRRQVDGKWGEWTTIPTVRKDEADGRSFTPPVPQPVENPQVLDENPEQEKAHADRFRQYQSAIGRVQRDVLRPPFYNTGTPWVSPYAWHKFEMEDSPAAGGGVTPVNVPRGPGIVLPGSDGLLPPPTDQGPQTTVAERKDYTEMWFNDILTLEKDAGKTVQYRVRAFYLNPYATLSAADARAEDRAQIEIATQWSEPSAAVTLPEPVRFFFVGQGITADRANVDLYRWIHGQWYKAPRRPTFEVGQEVYLEQEMDLEVPTPRGPARLRKVVKFQPGVSVVDVRDDVQLVSGRPMPAKRLVYLDSSSNVLGSQVDVTGKQQTVNFANTANAQRVVKERRVREQTPEFGPEYEPEGEIEIPPEFDDENIIIP